MELDGIGGYWRKLRILGRQKQRYNDEFIVDEVARGDLSHGLFFEHFLLDTAYYEEISDIP